MGAYLSTYDDLYWVLDDAQQRLLLTLGPTEFDNDRGVWGLSLAETWWARGNPTRARAYGDSAAKAFEQQLREHDDVQRRGLLALAHAYAGRKAEAIRIGEQALADAPIDRDWGNGTYLPLVLARIYVLTGENEKAVDRIAQVASLTYYVSPAWMGLEPIFAPLRENPRFKKLIGS